MMLSAVEILEPYAKRWSIEVFFKTCKGFLGFEDDTRSLIYDTLAASKTICLLRYIQHTISGPNQIISLFLRCFICFVMLSKICVS